MNLEIPKKLKGGRIPNCVIICVTMDTEIFSNLWSSCMIVALS